MATWVEYGVLLRDGSVASAATRDVAWDYAWGRPVARKVRCTAIPKSGEAVVDIGAWEMCKKAAS